MEIFETCSYPFFSFCCLPRFPRAAIRRLWCISKADRGEGSHRERSLDLGMTLVTRGTVLAFQNSAPFGSARSRSSCHKTLFLETDAATEKPFESNSKTWFPIPVALSKRCSPGLSIVVIRAFAFHRKACVKSFNSYAASSHFHIPLQEDLGSEKGFGQRRGPIGVVCQSLFPLFALGGLAIFCWPGWLHEWFV